MGEEEREGGGKGVAMAGVGRQCVAFSSSPNTLTHKDLCLEGAESEGLDSLREGDSVHFHASASVPDGQ